MKIGKQNLLVVAGVVWIAAGANVAALGIASACALQGVEVPVAALLALAGFATFGGFHAMFGRIVGKNAARIRALEAPRQNPLRFLDAKGYAIMAFMMALGFGLRFAGIVPTWFIAFFYTGLGLALVLAGGSFLAYRAQGRGWAFHKKLREPA